MGAGPTITLKDPTAAQQEFMAPPAGLSGEILTFELTVEDVNGLQSTDVVTITINDNGIAGFPDEAITRICEGGDPIGITEDSGGRLAQLETVDPATIPNSYGIPGTFQWD